MDDATHRTVKALSLHNGYDHPWADMIATGIKTVEVRTWQTAYRGLLLICAAKFPDGNFSGQAVCFVELINCRPMLREDEEAAQCAWEPGDIAWELRLLKTLDRGCFVKGRQRLFEVKFPVNLFPGGW